MDRENFENIVRKNAELMANAQIADVVAQKQKEWDLERQKLLDDLAKGPRASIVVNRPIEGDSYIYKSKIKSGLVDSEDWLTTYADTITLLMAFFVILFTMSKIDSVKYDQFAYSMKKDVLKQTNAITKLEENLKDVINNSGNSEGFTIVADAKGITLELPTSTLYDPGSAAVKGEFLPVLTQIVNTIKNFQQKNYIVEIEGHTDNAPINNAQYPSNWELSTNRATNVVRYFIEQGIDAKKLRAAGYADSKPKKGNVDNAGNPVLANMAENRRVVIIIKLEEEKN